MLASIFSLNVLQTALELGCIYALVALALFLRDRKSTRLNSSHRL